MSKSSMNILVTGGAGYIGSSVSNLLIDQGYNVTIFDNLITGHEELIPSKAKFEKLDISDTSNIKKIFKNKKFSAVFHFAGLIRVGESIKFPEKYMNNNFEKSKIFLNTCFDNDIKKVIFSSTAAVYGNAKKNKLAETEKINPLNPYAESKIKLENFLIDHSIKRKIKYVILRYFNVAGADIKMRTGLISKFSSHLIKIACEVATGKKEKLVINGDDYDTPDGTTIRDYIHISDLADIHLLCLKYLINNNKSEIFNCGYGKGYSVKEVIKNLNELLSTKIKTEVGPRRDGDSESLVSNPIKFNNTISWQPKYNDLKIILKTALDWEKKIFNIK